MPSFDIVSKPDIPAISNAIDGVLKEINTRYDFKGSHSNIEIKDNIITIFADDELKRRQVKELLNTHITRKKVNTNFLDFGKIVDGSHNTIRQQVEIKTGISRDDSQKIIKLVKTLKNKVQIQIQGDELRVSCKKRDDLQLTIQFIKENFSNLALQFQNFRD